MSLVIRSSIQSDTELACYRQQNVRRTEDIPDTVSGRFVVLERKRIQYTADYKPEAPLTLDSHESLSFDSPTFFL